MNNDYTIFADVRDVSGAVIGEVSLSFPAVRELESAIKSVDRKAFAMPGAHSVGYSFQPEISGD